MDVARQTPTLYVKVTIQLYAGAVGGWHLRTHAEQADGNKRVDAVDTLHHNYLTNGGKKVDLI